MQLDHDGKPPLFHQPAESAVIAIRFMRNIIPEREVFYLLRNHADLRLENLCLARQKYRMARGENCRARRARRTGSRPPPSRGPLRLEQKFVKRKLAFVVAVACFRIALDLVPRFRLARLVVDHADRDRPFGNVAIEKLDAVQDSL
jgi:hypothetical protein